MPRVPHWICPAILALLVAAGCGDDSSPSSKSGTSKSPSVSPSVTEFTPSPTEPTVATPTASPTRMSGIAFRTGVTITHNNQPIDEAGLLALGWTILADAGEARWVDPTLGSIHVVWDIPDERAVALFDVSLWGDVTGNNLAMAPSVGTTGFVGGPIDTGAHAIGGVTAEAPVVNLRVDVPEQLTGSAATVSYNLGWPQPVLVTYNYVYG